MIAWTKELCSGRKKKKRAGYVCQGIEREGKKWEEKKRATIHVM